MKNKYIEELIDTYYLEEKQKHDLFKGRGIFPYDITIIGNYSHLYEKSEDFLISLTEEYHISNMFDEVIDEIESIYKNNLNKDNVVLDTGYYLYYENNFPKLSNNPEKLVEKKYQIYIKLLNDPYNLTYGAVEKDNDIIIQLNTGTIQNDYDLLRETCKHEFLHVREMYSKEQTNILLNKKNRLPEDIDNAFTWDNNVEEFAVNMCILFQPSELRARINAYAEALKLHSYTTFEESLTRTDNITLQDAMPYYIKRLTLYLETNNYAPIEIIMYYCQKYSITHTKYKSFSFEKRKMNREYSKDELDLMNAFIFELKHILLEFRNNLHKQYFKLS